MQKIIVAFVAAPPLALAGGVAVGALAWLITLPFHSVIFTVIIALSVMVLGALRPWLAYRRWKINHQPKFRYGGPMQEYTAYEKARAAFDVRQQAIARPLRAWTVGLVIGFLPLTILSSLP